MVDAVALMVECDLLVGFQPIALDGLALGKPLIGSMRLAAADVRSLDEAQLGLEAGAEIQEVRIEVERMSGARQLKLLAGPAE